MKSYSKNIVGAFFMSVSMAGFVANDAIMKIIASELNLEQSIFIRGIFCTLFILVFFSFSKNKNLNECFKILPLISIRSFLELLATIFFLTALINMPFANVNAILQSLPLTITIAASIFLKESFGLKRGVAIILGLVGVFFIIKPGSDGFNYYSILAIFAVLSVTFRDILTRQVSKIIPAFFISLVSSMIITSSMGFYIVIFQIWDPINFFILFNLGLSAIFLMIGYFFSIEAMRYGDVSFVSPFRYTLIVWALLIGIFFFNETLDYLSFIGILLIMFSGIFVLYRESKIKNFS